MNLNPVCGLNNNKIESVHSVDAQENGSFFYFRYTLLEISIRDWRRIFRQTDVLFC